MLETSVNPQCQTQELVFDGLLEDGRLVYRPKIWQAIQRLKSAGIPREEMLGLLQLYLYPGEGRVQDTQRDIDEAFAPPKPPEPVKLPEPAPAPTADLTAVIDETDKQSPKRKPRRVLTDEEIVAKAERKQHKLVVDLGSGLINMDLSGELRRYPGLPDMLIHQDGFALMERPHHDDSPHTTHASQK